jgi:hypothetical protein
VPWREEALDNDTEPSHVRFARLTNALPERSRRILSHLEDLAIARTSTHRPDDEPDHGSDAELSSDSDRQSRRNATAQRAYFADALSGDETPNLPEHRPDSNDWDHPHHRIVTAQEESEIQRFVTEQQQLAANKNADKRTTSSHDAARSSVCPTQLQASLRTLNARQRSCVDTVMSTLTANQQFVGIVSGPGGVGKSFLIHTLQQVLEHEYGHGCCRKVAPSGIVAANMHGETIQSALSLRRGQEYTDKDVAVGNSVQASRSWENVKLLVVDEFSMVSINLLGTMSLKLRNIRGNSAPFGGLSVLFLGDEYQITPVGSLALSKVFNPGSLDQCTNICSAEGHKVWSNIEKVILLDEPMRQRNPRDFELLSRVRVGAVTQADVDFLNSRSLSALATTPEPSTNTWLLGRLQHVHDRNNQYVENIREPAAVLWAVHRPTKATIRAKHTRETHTKLLQQLLDTADNPATRGQKADDKQLPPVITLKKGTRVWYTRNDAVQLGICNGALGTVVGFLSSRNKPWRGNYSKTEVMELTLSDRAHLPTVLVRFDDNVYRGEGYGDYGPGVVPVRAVTTSITQRVDIDGMVRDISYQRDQIPLQIAGAMTIHKAQGSTLSQVCTDITDLWDTGMAYVALSRVRSLDTLYLLRPFTSLEHALKCFIPKLTTMEDNKRFTAHLQQCAARTLLAQTHQPSHVRQLLGESFSY